MENELKELIIKYGQDILPRIAEYEIHSSTFNAVVFMAVALVAIALMVFAFVYRSKKRANGEFCGDPEFDFVWYLCLGVLAFILFAMAMFEVSEIYYAKYLPEKLLLRKLKYVLENL